MKRPTTITIACESGPIEIEAFVFGCWAAHALTVGHGWGVTHVPSGLAAVKGYTMSNAIACARRLAARVPALPIGKLQTKDSVTKIRLSPRQSKAIRTAIEAVR